VTAMGSLRHVQRLLGGERFPLVRKDVEVVLHGIDWLKR